MSRAARIDVAGFLYHVIVQGVKRRRHQKRHLETQLQVLMPYKLAESTNVPMVFSEQQARANADIPAAVAVFKGQQTDFHTESNLAKNSSLYVDFKDEEFIAPSERITEVMVRETASRNAEFLALTGPKVEMMSRWKSNPAEAEGIVKLLRNRLEQLRSDMPDDPEKAMSVLMEDLLSEVKKQ